MAEEPQLVADSENKDHKELPGKKRKPRTKVLVAKRIAAVLRRLPRVQLPEGVTPLNSGFFQLEAIRASTVAREKAKAARKIKGKGAGV